MRIEPAIPIDLEASLVDRVYHPVGVWQEATEADVPVLSTRRLHRRIGRGDGLFPHPPRAAESTIRRERPSAPIDRLVGREESMRDRRAAQRRRALGIDRPGGGEVAREVERAGADRPFENPAERPAHGDESGGRRGAGPAHHLAPGRRNAAMSSIRASERAMRPFIWRKAWIMPS